MATPTARTGRFGSIRCYRIPIRLEPRKWTAKAVGRVAKYALDGGATTIEICEQLDEQADIRCGGDQECERKRQRAVAVAQQLIQGNNQTLAIAQGALNVIAFALRGMLIATRAIPVLRPLQIPTQLAVTQIGNVRLAITARKAANDDLFRLVANL